MSGFIVREASRSDIHSMAAIHQEALPNDYLPSLGRKFLEGYFFPCVFSSPRTKTFVCMAGNRVVGFVIACEDGDQLAKRLGSFRPFRLALHLLAASARNWKTAVRTLETAARGSGRPANVRSELYLIAVSSEARGQGAGGALVKQLREYLLESGHAQCRVKVDEADAEANAFYEKNGFRLTGTQIYHGRRWNWRTADWRIASHVYT